MFLLIQYKNDVETIVFYYLFISDTMSIVIHALAFSVD